LIGYLGREDVWSFNDSSLHRGITLALKDEINLTEIVEGFSPYRTILARHIWKALDEGLLVSG
jgi:DNA-3-methyladenine glycosylase II